jgi:hypothetical protein
MKSYKIAAKTRHFEALATLAKNTSPEHFKNPDLLEIGRSLYRRLLSLERKAGLNALNYCNGEEWQYGRLIRKAMTSEEYDAAQDEIEEQVKRLFDGNLPAGFFINGDPRGYALKIDNNKVTIPAGLHTDWGGYGILAPEEF